MPRLEVEHAPRRAHADDPSLRALYPLVMLLHGSEGGAARRARGMHMLRCCDMHAYRQIQQRFPGMRPPRQIDMTAWDWVCVYINIWLSRALQMASTILPATHAHATRCPGKWG